jgi:hypothetical protein
MNAPTTSLARAEDRMRSIAVPLDADAVYNIAVRMWEAQLVPSSFKTVDQAFLAMMKGAEYGILPQSSLGGFYVINNVAQPYGTMLNGIIKATPSFDDEIEGCIEGLDEMRFVAAEANDYKEDSTRHSMFAELQRELRRRLARVESRLKGKEAAPYLCGWSVLVRKGKAPTCVLFDSFDSQRGSLSGGNWQKWPQRMHMHRAATNNRKDNFGDAIIGLDMTAEEAMEASGVIDLGTQAPPPPPPTGSPVTVLRDLSKPRIVDVVQPPPVVPGEEPQSHPPDIDAPPAPVDVASITPTARGLTALGGTDALKGVIARIKEAGGRPDEWKEAACMRALNCIKAVTKMSSEERHRVAMELAQLWDEDVARLAAEAAQPAEQPAPVEPPVAEQPAPDAADPLDF